MSVLVWALVILAGATASAETLGSITTIEEHPNLAQVEFYNQGSWIQQCSGTILTNYHILSLASCFDGEDYNPNFRRFRVGTSTRGVGGHVENVREAIIHPNFGTLGIDANIAVVFLSSYLTFSDAVQQAPILGQGIELPYGLVVNFAGWGTTAEGGQDASDDLYALNLLVQQQEDCLVKYYDDVIITENMICLGLDYGQGRDLDLYDAGASLSYQGTAVGLMAFGHDNADDEYPAVATAIGSYTSWIIENAV